MEFTYHFNDKITLSGEAEDLKQTIRGLSFLEELPRECPLCSASLMFFYRTPQDYKYYGLRCTGDPEHETNFGQYKSGGLFYKGEWQKRYTGDSDSQEKQQSQSKPKNEPKDEPPPPGDSDMPF